MKNVSVIDLAALPQVSRKVIGMDLATRETGTEFADLHPLERAPRMQQLTDRDTEDCRVQCHQHRSDDQDDGDDRV